VWRRTPEVADLMTRDPVIVAPADRLAHARDLLLRHRIRHLPVVHDAELVGVLSIRDLLPAEDEEVVADVMSRDVYIISERADVREAADQLLRFRVSCLPVVETRHQLLGILTTSDLLRWAIDRLASVEAEGSIVLTVAELMTGHPLITLEPPDRLSDAYLVMRAAQVHHLGVVGPSGRLVGMVTDRELLSCGRTWLDQVAGGEPADRGCVCVSDAMSPLPSPQFSRGDPAVVAARHLLYASADGLPVVEEGRLVGMLTVSDYLRYLVEGDRPRAAFDPFA
jgi:CBS domain-containing protein